MRFFILNSSGNVGKSTLARELLFPRLDNAKIIEVETVNKSTKDYPFFKDHVYLHQAGDNFDDLYLQIVENENLILDVGASQLGEFWRQLSAYAGVEQIFDYFIVPATATDKQMEDTAKTIIFLQKMGIEDEKIKVVFNEVSRSVKNDFSALLNAKSIDFNFDEELAISKSSVFKELGLLKRAVFEIYNPDLDFYRKKILEAKEPAEKLKMVKLDLANRMASKVLAEMDFVFEKITGQAPQRIEVEPEEERPLPPAEKVEEAEVSDDDDDL